MIECIFCGSTLLEYDEPVPYAREAETWIKCMLCARTFREPAKVISLAAERARRAPDARGLVEVGTR